MVVIARGVLLVRLARARPPLATFQLVFRRVVLRIVFWRIVVVTLLIVMVVLVVLTRRQTNLLNAIVLIVVRIGDW